MDWDAILHVALPVCKVCGAVGAFLGLSESLRSDEKTTGWKRFGPAALLLFAISAELIDAHLKHSEALKQQQKEAQDAVRDEELLRPVHRITVTLELFIPKEVLREQDPAYFKRIASAMERTGIPTSGDLEFGPKDPLFPKVKETVSLQALKAFYASDLGVYDDLRPPRQSSSDYQDWLRRSKSAEFWLELTPGTNYQYAWGRLEGNYREEFPPAGRRYMINQGGLSLLDNPISGIPEQVMLERNVRSIADMAGKELKVRTCPDGTDGWRSDERVRQLARMIYLRNILIEFEGVGTFGGLEVAKHFSRRMNDDGTCVVFTFPFPEDRTKLDELIN